MPLSRRRHRGVTDLDPAINPGTHDAQDDTHDKSKLRARGRSAAAVLLGIVLIAVVAGAARRVAVARASKLWDAAGGQHPASNRLGRTNNNNNNNPRFPEFGTADFAKQCHWALPGPIDRTPQCTIFVRPYAESHEGVAWWLSEIASNYMFAKQAGCRMAFDYGPGVDVRSAFVPHATAAGTGMQQADWVVPPDFECREDEFCYRHPFDGVRLKINNTLRFFGSIPGRGPLADVPRYRYSTLPNEPDRWFYDGMFTDLKQQLRGFQIETGMACALGGLLQLSPSATRHEPDLFNHTLPILRDEETLVIGLYIRTGNLARYHNQNPNASVDCALSLEQRYLGNKTFGVDSGKGFSRVAWMLVTDSLNLKKELVEEYGNKNIFAGARDQEVTRLVLVTRARGRHTRLDALWGRKYGVTDDDAGEALLDWYLLGESDVVVAPVAGTFGTTAALRTARPLYDSFNPFAGRARLNQCAEVKLVQNATRRPKVCRRTPTGSIECLPS